MVRGCSISVVLDLLFSFSVKVSRAVPSSRGVLQSLPRVDLETVCGFH